MTKEDIIQIFESRYVDTPLPDGLVECWADIAIGEYEREVGSLGYNKLTGEFTANINTGILDTIAYIMKLYYCEREFDRINKKINIIGKDLSLNDTKGAKEMAYRELQYVREQVALRLDQSKTPAYGGTNG